MAPDGWLEAPVRDFGSVSAGRQRSPNFTKGKIRPYLRVANVGDGFINTSDINQMLFTDEEYKRYELKKGDILLNEGQSTELVGRPAIYDGQPPNCCFQNTLIRFKANQRTYPAYALHRFRLCLYDGTFQAISKKTTSIAHLGVSRFADLVMAWPPIDEQVKIAEILSTWDQRLAATEQLTLNSKLQKQTLMHHLLTGNMRLPGFKDSWQKYQLGQILAERSEINRLDLRLLSITGDQGVIYRDDVGRKDTSSEDKSKYKRLCPGDIGYNTMRMWQGVSALSDKEGIVSPAYTILVPGKKAHPEFMAYFFKLPKTIHTFYRFSQGLVSDTWNLKYTHFKQIKVTIPSVKEQEKIASVLKTADMEIANLQMQLQKLQLEKKALMQQLLTGKRRVKV